MERFTIPKFLHPYLIFLPTVALFLGFLFDIFTLGRPDALFGNITILGYLSISTIITLVLQARSDEADENLRLILLGIIQFSFGNLTSALLVLYSQSGTLAGSAIFIGMLVALLLGNEVLRDRYARTQLRVIILYILLLTYATLSVPILLNQIGTPIFLISNAVALGVIFLVLMALTFVSRNPFGKTRRRIWVSIIAVTLIFNGLYFTNLIPPVPLALKHIGIYHSVIRTGDTYTATYEAPQWYEFWKDTNTVLHNTANEATYCFSSVFATTDLKTDIRHRWEKYNSATQIWETMTLIPFPITGGRQNGYRGYTQTMQVDSGLWRCSVETSRGTLIGRTEFNVQSGIPELHTTEL